MIALLRHFLWRLHMLKDYILKEKDYIIEKTLAPYASRSSA